MDQVQRIIKDNEEVSQPRFMSVKIIWLDKGKARDRSN